MSVIEQLFLMHTKVQPKGFVKPISQQNISEADSQGKKNSSELCWMLNVGENVGII